MTGIYTPSARLTRPEQGKRTRVEFLFQGRVMDSCEYEGGLEVALEKALEDRYARAKLGALPKGLHEVRAGKETRSFKVD